MKFITDPDPQARRIKVEEIEKKILALHMTSKEAQERADFYEHMSKAQLGLTLLGHVSFDLDELMRLSNPKEDHADPTEQ